jgi:hypothetical protein
MVAEPVIGSFFFTLAALARPAWPYNHTGMTTNWTSVPTRSLEAGGITFAYRELGTEHPGPPVVFLVHLAAVMDNWDPRVVDGLAEKHHVVVFDNRGVGATSGAPATSIEQMAVDAITFVRGSARRQR